MFRVPGALNLDLGEGAVDVAEIVGTQFDASRAKVLVQTMQLRGASARNDTRLLSK
jgi:hypothetical protein